MEKKKSDRIKIRKTWTRKPTEKIVLDKDPDLNEYNKRRLQDEALEDYEDTGEIPND
jgi:hypothetical protein